MAILQFTLELAAAAIYYPGGTVSAETLGQPATVFRRLTNGVYVVGVADKGRAGAFTAAWITQVSFDPLLLLLSINREHASYPLLKGGGAFSVNVLGAGQIDLARHFGTQSGRETDKLGSVSWRPASSGLPILTEAVAFLECRVSQAIPAGDHELIVGQVVDGRVLRPDARPMYYAETGNLDGSADLYPSRFPGP